MKAPLSEIDVAVYYNYIFAVKRGKSCGIVKMSGQIFRKRLSGWNNLI
jgi:hypothetical protein